MRFLPVAIAILGLAAVAPAQGKPPIRQELPEIMRFMIRSIPTWKFSGTRVVEVRNGSARTQDREHVLRDGAKSRTFFPRDSARFGEVIVETPKERRAFDPKKNTILITRGMGAGTDRLSLLTRRGGKFTDEKADKVADRDTRVVSVSDERGRVQQRIWIDTKTGVILKRELYDMVGARESFFEFKTIDFSPTLAPGDFTLNVPGAKLLTTYDVAKEHGVSIGITPVFLPKDKFPLDTARIVRSPAGPFLHMTFASEEGMVSLFQAKGKLPTDRMSNGKGNRFTVVAWVSNNNSFALIGRGSAEKLERIARLIGKS
jgi:outer membrane lipoprotein-sorting protein